MFIVDGYPLTLTISSPQCVGVGVAVDLYMNGYPYASLAKNVCTHGYELKLNEFVVDERQCYHSLLHHLRAAGVFEYTGRTFPEKYTVLRVGRLLGSYAVSP